MQPNRSRLTIDKQACVCVCVYEGHDLDGFKLTQLIV